MIVMKLGKWVRRTNDYFIYERIMIKKHIWTPFCFRYRRYIHN